MKIFSKKTKIIATLGPASAPLPIIESLINEGVDVFRLNFSHGTYEFHQNFIDLIVTAGQNTGTHPGILADLQGPKIRTGRTLDDQIIELKEGSRIKITTGQAICTGEQISIDYPELIHEIKKESRILINDGAIALKIIEISLVKHEITCVVLNTGSYSSHKGVNFPDTELSIPALTQKDKADLTFILGQNIQFVALSFVRRASDLCLLKEIIDRAEKSIKIIAKIEKPEAAKNVDEILQSSDGIMVARGDLGVETSVAEVPIIQKDLIKQANQMGKTVIVATQMLESMIQQPLPTRAESTDVANAIFDGTDAVMLSGETAMGKYPVQTVQIMSKIIRQAESSAYYCTDFKNLDLPNRRISHAVCEAAAWASRDLNHSPIIVFTLTGHTAWYLSKIRASSPIFAFSPDQQVISQLALAWNVRAFVAPFEKNWVRLIEIAEQRLLNANLVQPEDTVIIISGTIPVQGATNFMRIKKVGEN